MTKRRQRGLERLNGQRNIMGKRLYLARHRHTPPWTMQELSETVEQLTGLDINTSTISKIEVGNRGVYDWEVAAFAQALGVSTDWLLGLSTQLRFKQTTQSKQRS